jgi:hypothetical protein
MQYILVLKIKFLVIILILGLVHTGQAQDWFRSSSIYVTNSYTKFPVTRNIPNNRFFRHYNYQHSIMIEGTRNVKNFDFGVMIGYTFLQRDWFQFGVSSKFYPISFIKTDYRRGLFQPYIRGEYQSFIRNTSSQGGFITSQRQSAFSLGAGVAYMLNEKYDINFETMLFGFNDFRLGVGRRF